MKLLLCTVGVFVLVMTGNGNNDDYNKQYSDNYNSGGGYKKTPTLTIIRANSPVTATFNFRKPGQATIVAVAVPSVRCIKRIQISRTASPLTMQKPPTIKTTVRRAADIKQRRRAATTTATRRARAERKSCSALTRTLCRKP